MPSHMLVGAEMGLYPGRSDDPLDGLRPAGESRVTQDGDDPRCGEVDPAGFSKVFSSAILNPARLETACLITSRFYLRFFQILDKSRFLSYLPSFISTQD